MAIQKTHNHNNEFKKGLYLVPTPIGNLGDVTLRAIDVLRKSEYILCEDTRVSRNLLDRFDIKSKLISNHKFNEKKNLPKVISLLKKGSIVSLITDAGTPGISDPGAVIVKECVKENLDIFPLPGPSAITAAVSISGFSEKYFFYGFFPEKEKIIKDDLEILSKLDCSLIFFISPKKINKIIPIIKKNFVGRDILICREISKFYEEYTRNKVDTLQVFDKIPKGEFTIVISEKKRQKKNDYLLNESDKRNIKGMINKLKIKEIVSIIGQNSKVPKREIYNYCLRIKNEK
tara:strand:+ start:293 stop:1159 length:867 start_codon:yes stop_codon:yes gene_type:complete